MAKQDVLTHSTSEDPGVLRGIGQTTTQLDVPLHRVQLTKKTLQQGGLNKEGRIINRVVLGMQHYTHFSRAHRSNNSQQRCSLHVRELIAEHT